MHCDDRGAHARPMQEFIKDHTDIQTYEYHTPHAGDRVLRGDGGERGAHQLLREGRQEGARRGGPDGQAAVQGHGHEARQVRRGDGEPRAGSGRLLRGVRRRRGPATLSAPKDCSLD